MSRDRAIANFRVKKPCKNCPFTADKQNSIMLNKGRREGIIDGLMSGKDQTFVCHKTLDGYRAVCAGAVAVCKKRGKSPFIVQLAERMDIISEDHYSEALALSVDNFELGV